MAAVWKGVTNFLETVDQKAGEIAARTTNATEDLDEEDEEEGAEATEVAGPSVGGSSLHGGGIPRNNSRDGSHSFPSPVAPAPSATAGSNTGVAKDIEKHRSLDSQDKASAQRDARFLALQSDYAKLVEMKRQLESTVDEAVLKLDTEHALRLQFEATAEDLRSRGLHSAEESEHIKEELNRAEAEVLAAHQALDEARRASNAETEARKSMQGELQHTQAEWQVYKGRVKFLLEEKDIELAQSRVALLEAERGMKNGRSAESDISNLVHEKEELTKALASVREVAHLEKIRADSATKELAEVNSQCENSKQKLERLNLDLLSSRDLFESERAAHATTRTFLKDIQQENSKAAERAAPKPASASSALDITEVENRARELAELLMEKQAALEARRSEADQWRTRYEVSQQRLREAELVGSSLSGVAASSYHRTTAGTRSLMQNMEEGGYHQANEGGEFSKSHFFGGLSNRGTLGKKITDVAERIDKVSLRTGGLLKRNSVLRVVLLVYVLVLHIWVFVAVSMSSALPENARGGVPEIGK